MTTPTDSAAAPAMFLENMRQLWRCDPRLALEIDRLEDDQIPAVEVTRSGALTLKRQTPDGRSLYLHSRYDPVAEANKWVDQQLDEDKFCYIIEGLGLGYHVKALMERSLADVAVVVLEPNVPTIRAALTHVDLTTALESRRLILITRTEKGLIHDRMGNLATFIMAGTKIAAHKPSQQMAPAFFVAVRPLLTDFISYTKTGVMTLVLNSQVTCRNIAGNLATYVATPPIDELKNRFKGHPAIVVSAGPSLHNNIDQLGQAKNKAVIVATQTTFKPLLDREIIPDFVCSLDYHLLSKQYYEDVKEFHDVHLIAEPKAHPSVIDAYRGPVSLLFSSFARQVLGSAHPPRDGLPAGSSVAHLAFYLAQYLGCDPVIFIGQDLALTNHVYYAPGIAIHDAWSSELNRYCTMEMKEWESIMRSKPILRKVKDWSGREIYTEDLMFNYLEQFERDFACSSQRIIDATEGGAAKRGAEPMKLVDALRAFCTTPIDAQRFEYRKAARKIEVGQLRLARNAVATLCTEIHQIKSVCDETIIVLKELQTLLDQPQAFNRKLRKVDELRMKVKEHEHAYDIIVTGAQLAEFRKFRADQRLKASRAQGADRARIQLKRDREFVEALQEDSARMLEIMEHSLARFDTRLEQTLES